MPPSYGYGQRSMGPIPAGSTLGNYAAPRPVFLFLFPSRMPLTTYLSRRSLRDGADRHRRRPQARVHRHQVGHGRAGRDRRRRVRRRGDRRRRRRRRPRRAVAEPALCARLGRRQAGPGGWNTPWVLCGTRRRAALAVWPNYGALHRNSCLSPARSRYPTLGVVHVLRTCTV